MLGMIPHNLTMIRVRENSEVVIIYPDIYISIILSENARLSRIWLHLGLDHILEIQMQIKKCTLW